MDGVVNDVPGFSVLVPQKATVAAAESEASNVQLTSTTKPAEPAELLFSADQQESEVLPEPPQPPVLQPPKRVLTPTTAANAAELQQLKNPYPAIASYCDVGALRSLMLVCKEGFKAATNDAVWEPIVASLGIKSHLGAYDAFKEAYEELAPLVSEKTEFDIDHTDRLARAARFASQLPSLFDQKTLEVFFEHVSKVESTLVEQITSAANRRQRPDAKVLAACDMLFKADRTHFQERVISAHFAYLPQLPAPAAAFVASSVSQHKLEVAFQQVSANLQTIMVEEVQAEQGALPKSWSADIQEYMSAQLLAAATRFSVEVLQAALENGSKCYLEAVPLVYSAAKKQLGPHFSDLDGKLLTPLVKEFSDRQTEYVKEFATERVQQWNESLLQRETETEKYIWSSVPKKSDKSSFMSAFKWAFAANSATDAASAIAASEKGAPATEFEAQTAVLVSKLRGMESLVSIELVIEVLDTCRVALNRLRALKCADSRRAQQIYCAFLSIIGDRHIRPAFQRALKVLNEYDPKKYGRLMITMERGSPGTSAGNNTSAGEDTTVLNDTPVDGTPVDANPVDAITAEAEAVWANSETEVGSQPEPQQTSNEVVKNESSGQTQGVEPLVVFTELVNVGDIVQQMAHVFYEEELISTKLVRKSDFSAPSVSAKRKFEQMLDDMLAAGLSRGIDVLMDQVEFTLVTEQLGSDYLPLPMEKHLTLGPTKATEKVISLVSSHLSLLRETTEKSLYEVFQHEVGVRLYTAISKHLKKQIINEQGAVVLISDMNAYYAFVLSLRQRSLLPYYEALKQIAQLFLIDKSDAKQIGQAMSDSSRYNNLLTPDDLLEFVKRRRDWPSIKHKVEKTLYGAFECVVS